MAMVARYDPNVMELIVLELGDLFQIEVEWNCDRAVMTGAFALAGTFLGGYTGGRMGAAIGAGVGTVTGYQVSKMVSLRSIWLKVKEQLQELMYIVFNFLRRFDHEDYLMALQIVLTCGRNKRELAFQIVEFISEKLGRETISSLIAV